MNLIKNILIFCYFIDSRALETLVDKQKLEFIQCVVPARPLLAVFSFPEITDDINSHQSSLEFV